MYQIKSWIVYKNQKDLFLEDIRIVPVLLRFCFVGDGFDCFIIKHAQVFGIESNRKDENESAA